MPWFKLTGDARITQRCASEDCAGQPAWRLEAGDHGSSYCSGCKEKIEHQVPYRPNIADYLGRATDNAGLPATGPLATKKTRRIQLK